MLIDVRRGRFEYNLFCLCGQKVEIYSEWIAHMTWAKIYYANDIECTECPTCERELNKVWETIYALHNPPLYKLDKYGREYPPTPLPTDDMLWIED